MRKTKAKKMPSIIPETKWLPLRRGDGKTSGYLEVFWSKALGKYASIPGVSRWKDTDGTIHNIDV